MGGKTHASMAHEEVKGSGDEQLTKKNEEGLASLLDDEYDLVGRGFNVSVATRGL